MNASRRIALRASLCAAFAVACGIMPAALHAQSPPDWSGYWIGEGLEAEISGFPGRGANYKLLGQDAPWNEEGRKRIEAASRRGADQKANGWGYPLMMNSAAPLQFLLTPDEILIINVYRDVRHVFTDGRTLPPEEDRWPTTWGESVGRWEGDTLVIETVSVRNPNRYFFSSPPLSEQARYVERIRKVGPDRIESTMTIEDPVTLSAPWVVDLAYTRAAGLGRMMHDDYDNDRSVVENGLFTIVPDE